MFLLLLEVIGVLPGVKYGLGNGVHLCWRLCSVYSQGKCLVGLLLAGGVRWLLGQVSTTVW